MTTATMDAPPSLRLPTRDAILAERARRSLRAFVEWGWPLVEPSSDFVGNWHLDRLCATLEAVTRGEIPRLIVNVPPGTSKSLVVSVFWPAWEWANDPSLRVLTASYSDALTIRDNLRVRDIVGSRQYQQFFAVRFRHDQNVKVRMDTTGSGWRIATSVGGRATGEHPDRIIIDDPHTAKQTTSDVERQTAIDWFDRTISSRGVSRGARVVVIMQRLHEQDLSGHLLARGGWRHIAWPMRYDPTIATADDARDAPGTLLWPALFDEKKVRQLEMDLGPYGAAGQLQQRPAPEGGGLFKREWFPIVDAAPVEADRCRGWDTAATEGAGDFTAGVKIAAHAGIFYIEHVERDQLSAAQVDARMKATVQTDGRACRQREEQEPGGSGKAVIEARLRTLVGYDYSGIHITGDKITRARPFRAQAEGGNVRIVRGEWNQKYLDELCIFPNGAHDDQVDASSCAFNELALGPTGFTRVRITGT